MKNRKGFTIVELVIAVAVTAILAAVTVPVLSDVIESANISADTQTVRNMNVILESESADGNVPTGGPEVIAILKENGFTKFRPQTKFYTFYWLIKQNVIILANEAGDPVYPEEYAEERYDDQNWVNLENPRLPPAPSETPEAPREFTVSLRISGASGLVFDKIPSTVTEGEKLDLIFEIPKDMQIRYRIKNITVLMEDGEETHKIDAPQGSQLDGAFIVGEIPTVNIPCVTGNIEIHVSIQEYCLVTIKGTNSEHMKKEEFRIWFQKGMRLHISRSLLEKEALNEGYRITSATASKGEHSLGEVFDPEINSIHARNINVTSDIDIVITTEQEPVPPECVSVTFTCNRPEYLKEAPKNATVKYGEAYQFQLDPADDGQYWIDTVTIYKGGKQDKIHYGSPGGSYGFADINMTEDLEINIHVVKYCTVTFEGAGLKDSGYTNRGLRVEWGVGALFEADTLKKEFIPEGYEIVSITAQMGERTLANVYDPEKQILHLRSITDNTVVTFEIREKQNN